MHFTVMRTTTAAIYALAFMPAILGLTLQTDDASIGFFRYGPTEDVWQVCRLSNAHDNLQPGQIHCARNNMSTAHRTSTRGAFVEFMTVAKKIEYVGKVFPPATSPSSALSRIQINIDSQVETVLLASTPVEGDSRVLWSKTFEDEEGGEDRLRLVRITNLDGGELELDCVAEIMDLPSPEGLGVLKPGPRRPPWYRADER